MFKKSGFTMLEIVTVLGIMTILGFGGMKIFDSMNLFRKKGEENYEIMMLHTAMIQNFRSDKACRFTLTPLGDLSLNPSIDEIRNGTNNVVFNKTNVYGNQSVQIDSMRTRNLIISSRYTTGGKSRGTINLEITYKRISKLIKVPANDPSRYIRKTIPLELDMNATTKVITNCYTKIDNAKDEALPRTCTSYGGTLVGATCNLISYPNLPAPPPPLTSSTMVSSNYMYGYTQNVLEVRYLNKDRNDSTSFNLTVGNLLTANNLTANVFVVSSDKRLKENISKIQHPLSNVLRLHGKGYNFKGSDKKVIGLLAQEAQTIFPEMVYKRQDGFWGISYDQFIPVLLEAIHENQQKIDKLKKLKKRLSILKQKIGG